MANLVPCSTHPVSVNRKKRNPFHSISIYEIHVWSCLIIYHACWSRLKSHVGYSMWFRDEIRWFLSTISSITSIKCENQTRFRNYRFRYRYTSVEIFILSLLCSNIDRFRFDDWTPLCAALGTCKTLRSLTLRSQYYNSSSNNFAEGLYLFAYWRIMIDFSSGTTNIETCIISIETSTIISIERITFEIMYTY